MARLVALEIAMEENVRSLAELHRALVIAKQTAWAKRVSGILRGTALKAVAEYTRRNRGFFVIDGPGQPTVPERAERERQIELVAGKISASRTYEKFESALTDLRKLGFFPDGLLVAAVQQSFLLGS